MASGWCIPTIILVIIGGLQFLIGAGLLAKHSDNIAVEMHKKLFIVNTLAALFYIGLSYYFCHLGNTLASWMIIILPITYVIYLYAVILSVASIPPKAGQLQAPNMPLPSFMTNVPVMHKAGTAEKVKEQVAKEMAMGKKEGYFPKKFNHPYN